MPLSPELLKVLVCPECRSPLKPEKDESELVCTNEKCRCLYPVRDGIPAMLPPEEDKAEERRQRQQPAQ